MFIIRLALCFGDILAFTNFSTLACVIVDFLACMADKSLELETVKMDGYRDGPRGLQWITSLLSTGVLMTVGDIVRYLAPGIRLSCLVHMYV
ncbi:hypothetical protein HanPI659440_Chr04g0167151 [Helianthus annuus]|nr:hypothetical protein HanPI659440_Chr04g0167151 [Helianthus annuus]